MFSEKYSFSVWPNRDIPNVAAGVYIIWKKDVLIYCGMSGRQIEKNLHKKKYGLITRLKSHASGRLSGDQFCVYIANRFVIPSLTLEELNQFSSGKITLDMKTKQYIHTHLDYQFTLTSSSAEAYAIEIEARSGALLGEKPFLNPL